ncbi:MULTISPECIES: trehalose-phosphatase [Aminobacterium]|jgi:trehalose-phosphatase|uniref:trehalose-phosphatase n=1 Tax=Aminobacterium TaxID=81466 RepID=UPI00257BAFFD|nr:trehalose-phosphatase [Aminobacterium sp. UBA4834]
MIIDPHPEGPIGKIFEQFWDSMGRSPSPPLLMSDYDGTLAPFVMEREKAFPWPGMTACISRIVEAGGIVVLISGRDARDVGRLSGLVGKVEIWGNYGRERVFPDGTVFQIPLDPSQKEGLETAVKIVEQEGILHWIEKKEMSVALHWRGRDCRFYARQIENICLGWESICRRFRLVISPFCGGIEVTGPDIHKGVVVKALLEEHPSSVSAYLGDDVSDAKAFAAMRGKGLSVLVTAEERETEALVQLSPPGEVTSFLNRWCACLARRRGASYG